MYHCHLHFYLLGHPCRTFDLIKDSVPLENFSHEFSGSDEAAEDLIVKADVIFVNLRGMDVNDTIHALTAGESDAYSSLPSGDIPERSIKDIILLAGKDDISFRLNDYAGITDVWLAPLSDEEIKFRFRRWQETCKIKKDYWQTYQYLEATINHIPNLVWYKNKEGIHEKVNDSFCYAVSKTKEQVQGRGHAYIWDVEHDDPACIKSEQEVMDNRKTYVSEEIIQTGAGSRLLTVYKSPLYDFDDSVMGTVGVAIDITKEHDYEQELIQKNQTLETLFSTMDCGVLCHTQDGSHVISINRNALQILGYETQQELEGEGFDLIAASVMVDDRERLQDSIKELKNEGDSVSVEYRVQHSDGKILYVMGNIKLVRERGELFYQRLLLDCTAQKLQEQKERIENEKLYTELVQALGIDYNLVCFFNLDTGTGIPLRVNDNYNHYLDEIFNGEISMEECMGTYIERFVYEEDMGRMYEAVSSDKIIRELSEKKSFSCNYRTNLNNTMKFYQMKVVRTGKWEEEKKIVMGLCSVDEEVRNEMKQKTLLEDALQQANKANRAKSVFLSNMSHDIRTPMNAIVGFTDLAISHIDHSEQVEEYLKKIKTSGNHLLSLINDILDMSRIESGKMHLEEKPGCLPDVLHGLRNILQADVYAKQLELYIDTVDVFDEEIFCDQLRLNQVLLNLLSNAVKYTPAGGAVSLRVTEKPGAPAGYANFEFLIKDTGIGMSEEFVARIFEPFERERNSTISKIQGTGLGMAITKNIIDMMGGTIAIKSEQNVGTEITVSFAFRLNADAKKPEKIPELEGCRALVVDDDFDTCDSVSYMLGQIGMRAEWTLSGKEAVLRTRQAVMRNDRYSVYLIDWLLPDMNGVEVTRRIRKEIGEEIPVIVLTAYDWSDIEDEAKQAGVTAFCSKPLFLSELRNCLSSTVHAEEEEKEDIQVELHHTGRILLAEDVELNQEIAVEILEDAGFEVEVAENGQVAVDMLKKAGAGYYQVVLMDIQMPVMDGYTATKMIRELEDQELAGVPIIAMSANAFEEDKREALNSGMDGHIAKPIDVRNLFDTLDQMLK